MTKKVPTSSRGPAAEQVALRRRIRGLYRCFDHDDWGRCFAHLDPKLRDEAKVEPADHARSLRDFKSRYGKIDIWFIRANFYLKPKRGQDRPFAYVYVLWQDEHSRLHLFRERWVKESGRWYTRVVGLVAHEGENGMNRQQP